MGSIKLEDLLEDIALLRSQLQGARAGQVTTPVNLKSNHSELQVLAQEITALLDDLTMKDELFSRLDQLDKERLNESSAGAGSGPLFLEGVTDEVRDAIAKRRIEVWYQPIVSAKVRNIVGFEALMRLRRTDGSILYPQEFIPLIEITDLINELTQLLLHKALRQLADWQQDGLVNARCFMSVNLASHHILSGQLTEMIANSLSQTQIPPALLKLEVTETVLIEQMDSAIEELNKIREMGCGIAIDDFGTGYSSLLYLQRLPLDLLKLDRAFVREMVLERRPMAIARTVCELAVVLGLDVIAEGVETIPQAELLESLGVKYLQGHWFKEPSDGPNLTQWLDSNEVHRFSRIIR